MKSGDLNQVESEMATLERQLAALGQRRVQLLQEELRMAEAHVRSLGGGSVAVSVPVAARRGRVPAAVKARMGRPPKSAVSAPAAPSAAPATRRGKKRRRMSSEDVRNRLIDVV